MCKFNHNIINVKREDPEAAGKKRISVVLIVSGLWMLLLLITLAFHLNHNSFLNNDVTEPIQLDRNSSNISIELCSKEDEIKLPILDTNFQLFNMTQDSEKSKMLQTSLLQIAEQFSKDFMAVKMSVGQVEFLAKKLNQQFEYVNRYLDQYGKYVDLFKIIQEPLRSVSDLTEKISQLYYSIIGRFEELFHLVKKVASSFKKMGRLEGALGIINRQMNTSVYKKMELDMAMESLKNISVELDLRLQQDQAELKTISYQWQWLQEKRSSAHCFANWEWNWWPFTYTTTSVCYGRLSEEDWANTKARFEQALWRSNCSTQALYSDAGEFFLNASSRSADSLAILKAESLGKLSDSASASMFGDPFLEWKNNLRKTIEEVKEEEAKYAFASTFIFGRKGIPHFVKQLKKMTKRKTINSVNLLKLLATLMQMINRF